jgi:hypothetical protein
VYIYIYISIKASETAADHHKLLNSNNLEIEGKFGASSRLGGYSAPRADIEIEPRGRIERDRAPRVDIESPSCSTPFRCEKACPQGITFTFGDLNAPNSISRCESVGCEKLHSLFRNSLAPNSSSRRKNKTRTQESAFAFFGRIASAKVGRESSKTPFSPGKWRRGPTPPSPP